MMDGPSQPVAPQVQPKNQSNNNNLFEDTNYVNNTNTTKAQQNNDMFGLLDINMGSTNPPPQQQSGGFGGDLLGFGN